MKTYKVFSIAWDLDYDVDDSLLGLKEEYLVELDDSIPEDEVEETLMDKVSNEAGYCIFQAVYEQIK